jgi:hypothetical protein
MFKSVQGFMGTCSSFRVISRDFASFCVMFRQFALFCVDCRRAPSKCSNRCRLHGLVPR